VLVAVGIVVLLEELTVREGLVADSAVEARLMEVLVQGLKVLALNLLFAARALGEEGGLVAVLAVGSVVLDEEFVGSDFLVALAAGEAADVVQPVQGLKGLPLNVLVAMSALGGSDLVLLDLLELIASSVRESVLISTVGESIIVLLNGLISGGESLGTRITKAVRGSGAGAVGESIVFLSSVRESILVYLNGLISGGESLGTRITKAVRGSGGGLLVVGDLSIADRDPLGASGGILEGGFNHEGISWRWGRSILVSKEIIVSLDFAQFFQQLIQFKLSTCLHFS
jgi:hypothetical protein